MAQKLRHSIPYEFLLVKPGSFINSVPVLLGTLVVLGDCQSSRKTSNLREQSILQQLHAAESLATTLRPTAAQSTATKQLVPALMLDLSADCLQVCQLCTAVIP